MQKIFDLLVLFLKDMKYIIVFHEAYYIGKTLVIL